MGMGLLVGMERAGCSELMMNGRYILRGKSEKIAAVPYVKSAVRGGAGKGRSQKCLQIREEIALSAGLRRTGEDQKGIPGLKAVCFHLPPGRKPCGSPGVLHQPGNIPGAGGKRLSGQPDGYGVFAGFRVLHMYVLR